jgi:nanoRNase/pAp phosphatase (c-di-AMP/oligoRNAs hydrolase)
MSKKYRLVTRSDFDGLICAVLLKEMDLIGDIKFVHPKDMQDGKIDITANDITTNLPYVAGAHLVFDHHHSETLRFQGERPKNYIIDPNAPSAARVVYEYYGGTNRFPNISDEMMLAVDKGDSANFSREEILFPKAWALLNYLMDARTGLGRFNHFRISNYELMMILIDYCTNHTVDEILDIPDVRERVDLFFEQQKKSLDQMEQCAQVHDNLVVIDFRNQDTLYVSNRFMIYALYPQCNISIHVLWGLKKQNTVLAVGKSILRKDSPINIGELMLKYGGGGHANAGTCQVDNDHADDVLHQLIQRMVE